MQEDGLHLTNGQESEGSSNKAEKDEPENLDHVPPESQPSGDDEASRLKDLATEIRDQNDLERDVNRQADQLLIDQADERDQKRLEKTSTEKGRLQSQLRRLQQRQNRPSGVPTASRISNEIKHLESQIRNLDDDLAQIHDRISQRQRSQPSAEPNGLEVTGSLRLPNESQRDFLIRTGKITPFSKLPGSSLHRSDSSLQGVLFDAEEEVESLQKPTEEAKEEVLSHRELLRPGLDDEYEDSSEASPPVVIRPKKRRKIDNDISDVNYSLLQGGALPTLDNAQEIQAKHDHGDTDSSSSQASQYVENSEADSFLEDDRQDGGTDHRSRRISSGLTQLEDFTGLDDGNENVYQQRLRHWVEKRRKARRKDASSSNIEGITLEPEVKSEARQELDLGSIDSVEDEWYLPHPNRQDTVLEEGFKVPGDVWPSLFDYQKTGVRWLSELYNQQVGGIVGDEMGLGKTIQIIAFLAGLHYSKRLTKPVLIIAPATVMKQWVNEFHLWWPAFRVSILHTSGSGMVNIGREINEEDFLLTQSPSNIKGKPKSHRKAKQIVDRVLRDGHILVTTYSGLQSYADLLIPIEWEYAVLDEGHKIRNPNAAITIYCKELRTANRIILSGTPMQNNLIELWSLFDFTFPMRLGTLVNFRQQFDFPIRQGGYANASNLQVQTALKCAETLKDAISPYLLQRLKADVASDLPQKTEQVLFCRLTKSQRDAYERFLSSDELKAIMNGKRQVLFGIDILRKICNHPDLVEHRTLSIKTDYSYGSGAKSGKMQVVKALLELWREQGHKTLLFAQHRIMLDILERMVRSMEGLNYRRMDGTTTISARQGLVDEFNSNPEAHVFLLTTKVGGLGVNLTGADRVIIFDPDWNPSTDVQARERAWRLGQKRQVMIYRLMTAGTIEEKIYHRQLFKQFLINKILRDPKERQTFQMKDLHDLFSLGGADQKATETETLFKKSESISSKESSRAVNGSHPKGRRIPNTSRLNDLHTNVADLTGVDHMEQFQQEDDLKTAVSEGNPSDARVMEAIFARSGVHSTLEHDEIIHGRKSVRADPQIIEREARRIAAEAAKELKKAGEAARNVPLGTPTWTGQFGTSGRPTPSTSIGRGRGGPSSVSILAGLQDRRGPGAEGARSRAGTPGASALPSRGLDFMRMIRDYLLAHGGSVHTQMLIDHFNRFCNNPTKTAQFKAMLTEMATLEKGSRGRGKWVLKEEYRLAS